MEIRFVNADLFSRPPTIWTSLPVNEVSVFDFQIADTRYEEPGSFELIVRAGAGNELSRTKVVFGESLLMENPDDYFASWEVELAGPDCSPVLPAVSVDSGDPFSSTFRSLLLMGLVMAVFVAAVAIPLYLGERRNRNRRQLEWERLRAEGLASKEDGTVPPSPDALQPRQRGGWALPVAMTGWILVGYLIATAVEGAATGLVGVILQYVVIAVFIIGGIRIARWFKSDRPEATSIGSSSNSPSDDNDD